MSSFAIPADVSVLLGVDFTDEQAAQCQGFLDQADELIRLAYPDLDDQVSEGKISPSTIALVEKRAARRIMLNPDAKQNEKVDDYSYGRTGVVADSEVTILDEEWAWLAPSVSTSDSFSIRMSNAGPSLTPPKPPTWWWHW